METAKPLSPVSGTKNTAEKGKAVSKNVGPLESKKKNPKEFSQYREKIKKNSMIPILKFEGGTLSKSEIEKKLKSYLPQKLCCGSCLTGKEKKDIEDKLKLIQEKEKCIGDYYLKIENLIQKFHDGGLAESGKATKCQARNPNARKIISEPLVFTQNKTKDDFIKDLENNVHQISEIWFKTSTDFSSSLNNLKNNPTLSPTQFELEKVKIQMAVKQTKSLTLVKTRNIITEVKKLFRNRELIRTELENLLNDDIFKCGYFKEKIEKNLQEKGTCTNHEFEKNKKTGGTGDSSKRNDLEIGDTTDNKSILNSIKSSQRLPEGECLTKCNLTTCKVKSSAEEGKKEMSSTPETQPMNVQAWEEELARKKESITNLNNRIFELQKNCNYHSLLYNRLQAELYHFHEKIQWNQILWKQIGKLKDQIRALQLSNKQLESQKTDLELKTSKLDSELERLLKVNQLLNQKEFLFKNQEPKRESADVFKFSKDKCGELRMPTDIEQEILAGKQNAINQLKAILDVMKDQENFAQKQIPLFQKKIEELEKSAKA